MGPDVGKVDSFPRYTRSPCLRSNSDFLLLLFLFFPCSLGLECPVCLGVKQNFLLKFLLPPQ